MWILISDATLSITAVMYSKDQSKGKKLFLNIYIESKSLMLGQGPTGVMLNGLILLWDLV